MAFQVGSAFLDACVLAVLAREDTYGYVLTQQMRQVVDISESTLYPVLRRLQKSGYLSTYDRPFQGRNRRYYRITEEGMKKYEAYRDEWIWHKARVDELMFGKAAQSQDQESGPKPGSDAQGKEPDLKPGSDAQGPPEQGPPKQERASQKMILKKEENEIGGGTEHE